MIIGITGATGQLGRLAIEALKNRAPDATIVALVRDVAKAADLGVAARYADYTKPESIAEAVKGLDKLVLISSSDLTDRAGQHLNVINAAKGSGIERLIYTSILNATDSPLVFAADHKVTEIIINKSGLQHTLLRNGWYTENYTDSLAGALEHGAMPGCSKSGRVSSASRKDYAEAIAVAAIETESGNRVYELAGDTAYTRTELAEEVARQTGKPFTYNDVPVEAYAGILEDFGLPTGFAATLADADAQCANGALFDDSKTLSTLIGRATTPMADSVKTALT